MKTETTPYTENFLMGHRNAQLDMSHYEFGWSPFELSSPEYAEWQAGFEHCFYVGMIEGNRLTDEV